MTRVALHVVAGALGGPRTYGIALARALARRGDLDLVVLTDRPESRRSPCPARARWRTSWRYRCSCTGSAPMSTTTPRTRSRSSRPVPRW
ncbi:MAG: hypothetical protein ACE5JG_04605 [Planctomycetota bacterium]